MEHINYLLKYYLFNQNWIVTTYKFIVIEINNYISLVSTSPTKNIVNRHFMSIFS